MSEFKNRIYYRLQMTLVSPLSVGSGDNLNTDHDVIVDANGNPFIPATAIAGVLKHSIDNNKPDFVFASLRTDDEKEKAKEKKEYNEECKKNGKCFKANKIFGYVPTYSKKDGENYYYESPEFQDKIGVYDARLTEKTDQFFITNRDSVKLKNKVGVDGAKFDMQAVEPGITFVSYLELLDSQYAAEIENALAKVDAGILHFGAKTTRGYGQVALLVKKFEIFDFEQYLDFALYDEEKWKSVNEMSLPDVSDTVKKITLSLKLDGGISIREYSTDVGMPDYETMSLHNNEGKKALPVIPGTSWAGAIRSRFEEIVGENIIENDKDKAVTNALFGFVNPNEKDNPIKSKVIFSETKIKGGTYKENTRNSIDRFSAATKNGALYTERTYYGGETKLEILIKKELDEKEKFALAATFADLHNGFLAVGGLTAVGRGLFNITAVNGSTETAKKFDADTLDIDGFIKEVF